LLEGLPFIKGTPVTGAPFVNGSATVTVTDGKLTLSNGPTGANNKICFLDIYALPAETAQPEITAVREAGNIKITWTGGGTLQSRAAVDAGAWVDVTSSGTHTESATTGNKFFRVTR
jgi:hypothetical protein